MTVAGLPHNIRERCRELNIGSKATLLDVARQFDEAAMFEFLSNYPEVKKQKEAAKRAERPSVGNGGSAAAAAPARETLHYSFSYRPEGSGFTVAVHFDRPSDHSRKGVMQALKQAFDDVKNEKIDV